MKFIRKVVKNGNSLQITIPLDLAKYLNLDKDSVIELQDENGKFGPYASFWLKEDKSSVEENEKFFD